MPQTTFSRHAALVLMAVGGLLAGHLPPAVAADETPRNLVVQAAEPVARKEQRLALVIGNSAYREAPLSNPVNDARAMAQALRAAGFTVLLHTDVDHRALLGAVRDFGDRLRQGGVGVFYYAGHGMQIKGRNYLIPIGTDIQREDEVAYAALDAQAVLDKMEAAANGANLMILDACRNNPFARSFRSSVQGLAQMEAPVGTLVAFATAPGSVASDGPGGNGLYTQHLLTAMRKPGAKVEDVFKQVRAAVRRESQGKQVPWEVTSLEGDLYFVDPKSPEPLPAGPVAAASPLAVPATAAQPLGVPVVKPTPPAAPAAARPSNAQGYTVGDKWNYQVVDKWKGDVIRNYSIQVGKIQPDGSWTIPDGGADYDEHGRVKRWVAANGQGWQAVPHVARWWPDMKVGEKRRFQYEMSGTAVSANPPVNRLDLEGRVVGIEAVKVPAGEFQAYRVEYKGQTMMVGRPGVERVTLTSWYVPELHTMVAYERESTTNGRLDVREREELTSFSLINPAPTR